MCTGTLAKIGIYKTPLLQKQQGSIPKTSHTSRINTANIPISIISMEETSVEESQEKGQFQPAALDPSRPSVASDGKPHGVSSDRAVQHDDNESEDFADKVEYPSMWKAMLIVSGLFMGVFLVALDQTIIGTAIPKITDEFKTIQVRNMWCARIYPH